MKTKILNKKTVLSVISLLVISALGSSVILFAQHKDKEQQFILEMQSEEDEYRKVFDTKLQELIDYCRNDPKIGFSSYNGHLLETEKYKEIEHLGIEYLPYMIDHIEKNPDRYADALIVAVQKIAKTYINEGYNSPNEWIVLWNDYVKSIPQKVSEIKKEMKKNKSKKADLVQFGVLAIPLILEDVKAGNEEMADVVRTILSSDLIVPDEEIPENLKDKSILKSWVDDTVPKDNDKEKWNAWIAENKGTYMKIKERVLKVK